MQGEVVPGLGHQVGEGETSAVGPANASGGCEGERDGFEFSDWLVEGHALVQEHWSLIM